VGSLGRCQTSSLPLTKGESAINAQQGAVAAIQSERKTKSAGPLSQLPKVARGKEDNAFGGRGWEPEEGEY